MNSISDLEKFQDKLRYKALCETIILELKITQSPLAVKFFYTSDELQYFKKGNDYTELSEMMSFCQLEQAALSNKKTLYYERKNLLCDNNSSKYDWQTNSNPKSDIAYLSKSVFGLAVAPLADARFIADTVNFYCDKQQADALLKGWVDAAGIEPWQPEKDKASPCSATVYTHNKSIAVISDTCSCSSEKDSEVVSLVLPADHLKHTVDQLQAGKLSLKGSSFDRPGDGFFRYQLG